MKILRFRHIKSNHDAVGFALAPPITTSGSSSPLVPNEPVNACVPCVNVSDVLVSLLAACGLSVESLPCGVNNSVSAATSKLCPPALRELARQRVALFGAEDVPSVRTRSPVRGPVPQTTGSGVSASLQREISLLREILPTGCERRMLGTSDHSFYQATPAMRWKALSRKYESAGGHDGRGWARDRRALARWHAFCEREGISEPHPIGAPAFSAFLDSEKSKSSGSKGGATVEHNLKVAFLHMKTHLSLEVELDAPCLFNMVKAFKGDSDAATSPSLWALAEWERLSFECKFPAGRLACQVATLACWLTLRASHFINTTVLDSSTPEDIRLNLARDKDGSTNVWAGCDATGLLGEFQWWPDPMQQALDRGFLVPDIYFDPNTEPDPARAEIRPSPADSKSLVRIFDLAFSMLGIPMAEQKHLRFTGHSPRHLLPSIAELILWLAQFRDELGRWATGAANAKRTKCGPRYTSTANRAMQLHLRRRIRTACVILLPFVQRGSPEAVVPCFEALASIPAILQSDVYGPSGVGYVPKF